MIINHKILENKNVLKKFTPAVQKKIKKDTRMVIRTYLKVITFKEINYSFEDFKNDNYCSLMKERKFYYNLYNKGYTSLNEYCTLKSLQQNKIYSMLKKGISKNTKHIWENPCLLEFLDYDIDVSKFNIRIFPDHMELFGDIKELKKFKEKHDIRYPVRIDPLTEEYHLAFSGVLFLFLKKQLEENKKILK